MGEDNPKRCKGGVQRLIIFVDFTCVGTIPTTHVQHFFIKYFICSFLKKDWVR
jgi:hypothetical protein